MVDVIIDKVRDGREQLRDVGAIRGIMIHRCGVDLVGGFAIGYDALSICDAFTGRDPRWPTVAKVTGRQNAYTFYIGGNTGPEHFDGKIWQALDIGEIGHHGRRFSASHLGIALIGDFRKRPPGEKQWDSAIDLCSDLCLYLGILASRVVGHGEVKHAHGGEKAPGEPAACPGDFCVMDAMRSAIKDAMRIKLQQDAFWRLESIGVRLP